MSDCLTNSCGCNSGCGFFGGSGNSCIWIILLLLFCGNGNGCGSIFGGDDYCCSIIWILLILSLCGNGSGCGQSSSNNCGCNCGC